jgi:hypothetical protein
MEQFQDHQCYQVWNLEQGIHRMNISETSSREPIQQNVQNRTEPILSVTKGNSSRFSKFYFPKIVLIFHSFQTYCFFF